MGYSKHGEIERFWPDDDDSTIYICEDATLSEITDKINEKWPGTSLDDIQISSKYIHTNCLTYDLYDSSDWTNFIVISKL